MADIQGGPAQPVQTSSQAPSAGPAIPVAVMTTVEATARGVMAGPVQPVVEVTDGRIRLGGAAIPVYVSSGNGFTIAGPPLPVYVVSGSFNPVPPGTDALLLETGFYILLESGDRILLE
jgi:hypothetical protein